MSNEFSETEWEDAAVEEQVELLKTQLLTEQGARGDLVMIALSLLGFCTALIFVYTFITVTEPDANQEFLSFIAGIAIANLPKIIGAITSKYTGVQDSE